MRIHLIHGIHSNGVGHTGKLAPYFRADVLSEFRRLYAYPATSQHTGPCKGWAIDHVIPLAVGGCDAVRNLQWLPVEIKSCAGTVCKDRWERRVYRRDK